MENSLQNPKWEKPHVHVQTQSQKQEAVKKQQQQEVLWDCGSTLYDSFELNSFKRQLDSAICSRTLSMPHLSNRKPPLSSSSSSSSSSSAQQQHPVAKKPSSKISRSLRKLLKSVFRSKQSAGSMLKIKAGSNDEYCVYYDKTGALTTIPEVPEIDFGGLSPEINSLATRRTASQRFPAPSIAISCA